MVVTTDPSKVPALAPPPGVHPNFVNPYSLNPAFVATTVLCLLFATLAVTVRLAVNLSGPNKKLRVEDYTSLVSWLGLVWTCLLAVLETRKGLGRHQWDVPIADMKTLLKLNYFTRVYYAPTILAAKLTILLQLMRIFVTTKRGLVFRLIQFLIWSNVCFYIGHLLVIIFQCTPVPKAWNASIGGHCIAKNVGLLASSTINVLSDVLILILPLWTIWHLKMPIQKKVSVSAAFAAGIFAVFAGIMRLDYSVQMNNATDLTFVRLQHGMWTTAEITTAIICASLPLIPKFLSLFRQQHREFTSSASNPRGSISSRRGLRPPLFLSESFIWPDVSKSGVSASGNEDQVEVTGAFVPADMELALANLNASGEAVMDGQRLWYKTIKGEEGIRKTVRIEQTC
ncbi:hypothetical protein N7G274_009669 [Stereocaulon virgatum]|uniref:Rhodopsin domain-containing protein n=1 Tax=Stereocaulon virgatum TaxID=373712 RepID=A0ABR3ZVC4_9LECA